MGLVRILTGTLIDLMAEKFIEDYNYVYRYGDDCENDIRDYSDNDNGLTIND